MRAARCQREEPMKAETYRILDCHFNLFRDDRERSDNYVAQSRRAGVQGACAFLSGMSTAGRLADDPNREPRELHQRYPDFVFPFARVHPDDGPRATAELERLVRKEGFRGLKLSYNNKATDPTWLPIVQKAAELGIPILVHTFMGRAQRPEREQFPHEVDVLELVDLARRVPEARLIMSHYNLGDWEYGLKAVRDTPNIHPSVSGSGVDSDSVEMGVRECGAERIIFGTDGLSLLWSCVGKVLGARLSETERRLIFADNLERLLSARRV